VHDGHSAHIGQFCAKFCMRRTCLVIINTKLIFFCWLAEPHNYSRRRCLKLSMLTFVLLGLLSAARKSDKLVDTAI